MISNRGIGTLHLFGGPLAKLWEQVMTKFVFVSSWNLVIGHLEGCLMASWYSCPGSAGVCEPADVGGGTNVSKPSLWAKV